MSMATLSALNDVQDAVVANKVPGESPTTIVTESMTMVVNRQERNLLSASPIQAGDVKDASSFVLPGINTLRGFLPSDYDGAIDTQVGNHNMTLYISQLLGRGWAR